MGCTQVEPVVSALGYRFSFSGKVKSLSADTQGNVLINATNATQGLIIDFTCDTHVKSLEVQKGEQWVMLSSFVDSAYSENDLDCSDGKASVKILNLGDPLSEGPTAITNKFTLSFRGAMNGFTTESFSLNYFYDPVVPSMTLASTSYSVAPNDQSVLLSGTCSENSESLEVSGDFSGKTSCVAGFWSLLLDTSSRPENGTFNFEVEHVDFVGNKSAKHSAAIVKAGFPSLTVSSPTATTFVNGSNSGTFPVSGTCSESGRAVDVSWGAGSSQFLCSSGVWSGSVNLTSLPDGSVTFRFNHSSGTYAAMERQVTVVKDTVAPVLSILNPVSNQTVSATGPGSISFSGSCEPGFNVILSDGAYSSFATSCAAGVWNYDLDTSLLSEGTHTMNATQVDSAGNLGGAAATVEILKDTQSPVLTLSGFPTGHSNVTSFNYSVTGEFNYYRSKVLLGSMAACLSALAGESFVLGGAGSYNLNIAGLTDGALSFCIEVKDLAGNLTSQGVSWIKDTTAPSSGFTIRYRQTSLSTALFAVETVDVGLSAYSYALIAAGGDCASATYSLDTSIATATPLSGLTLNDPKRLCVTVRDSSWNYSAPVVKDFTLRDPCSQEIRTGNTEIRIYKTAGTQTLSVPTDAYICMRAWGGGGGGAYNPGSCSPDDGGYGGFGGYSSGYYANGTGNSLSITVGAGGVGVASGIAGTGGTSTISVVSGGTTLVTAPGGGGATGGTCSEGVSGAGYSSSIDGYIYGAGTYSAPSLSHPYRHSSYFYQMISGVLSPSIYCGTTTGQPGYNSNSSGSPGCALIKWFTD